MVRSVSKISHFSVVYSAPHFFEFSFHPAHSFNQIEDQRRASEIDPQIATQTLHPAQAHDSSLGHQRFVCSFANRFEQA
jgi:hypothetical protein